MSVEPKEIWFARRFPIGDVRGGMAPVCWKGWMVVAVFVLGVALGGAAMAWFAFDGMMSRGVWAFVIVATAAGLFFLRMANHKGDHVNTVAEYEKGKLRV